MSADKIIIEKADLDDPRPAHIMPMVERGISDPRSDLVQPGLERCVDFLVQFVPIKNFLICRHKGG